ncbi:hypothetical protein C942_03243 [Photobacterium marinum]|uniref:Uncharacterized protein n=1 Tax=Photobacterium marinum TaxID=1056511 RepID=L8J6S9_9GAMM|nr:hypothetical protein [Photobacterium marinum]ELR63898.1 hypothetical protein C942_03243 [Photobacterium marinum]
MDEQLERYLGTLTVNQKKGLPDLPQSIEDIEPWLYSLPEPDKLLIRQRFLALKRPRGLQVPLAQYDGNKHANLVRMVLNSHFDIKLAYNDGHTKENTVASYNKIQSVSAIDVAQHLPDCIKACVKNIPDRIWQTGKLLKGSEGIHPAIFEQLEMAKDDGPVKPILQLADSAATMLRNVELMMKLKSPQDYFPYQELLNWEYYLKLSIHQLEVLHFETGVSMLVVTFKFHQIVAWDAVNRKVVAYYSLTVEDIALINHQLYRMQYRNKQAKLITLSALKNGDSRILTTWLDIVRSFLGLELLDKQWHTDTRPLVYSQLSIAEDPCWSQLKQDYINRLQALVCRRESVNYLSDKPMVSYFGDHDIYHCASREGGCLLVNPNNAVDNDRGFHQNFINKEGQLYFAVMMFAYSEYYFLYEVQNRFTVREGGEDEMLLSRLEAQQAKLLKYRINHRVVDISVVSRHNESYRGWSDVFRLAEYHRLLAEDLADYKNYIIMLNAQKAAKYQQEQQEQQEQQLAAQKEHNRKMQIIATFGTAFIFLTGVFGTNFLEMTMLYDGMPISFFSRDWHWTVIGLVFAITSWYIGRAYSNSKPFPVITKAGIAVGILLSVLSTNMVWLRIEAGIMWINSLV